jgi:hypothetical protein
MPIEKTVVKKRAYKKRATSKKATKVKSTPAPKKPEAISTLKTVITIAPDGVITISKTEETVTEQVMTKSEP